MRSIPIDVIEDILLKLPVKHLLRCKVLCKSCYALITSPRFIARHHRFSSTRSKDIVVLVHRPERERRPPIDIILPLLSPPSANYKEEESQVYVPPGPTTDRLRSFQIVGSCDGLLCAKNYEGHTVWNPATGEYIHLPPPNDYPSWHSHSLGFGYDAESNDYKLVKIDEYWRESDYTPFFKVELWSMNTNRWSVLPLTPDLLSGKVYGLHPVAGLLLRGSLYWLAFARKKEEESDGSAGYNHPLVVVSFDMSDKTLRTIALSDVDDRAIATREDFPGLLNKRVMAISDYMGSLSLFVGFSDSPHQTFFDLWVMDDDDDWTRRFSSIGPFKQGVVPTSVCVDNGNLLMKYKIPNDGGEDLGYELGISLRAWCWLRMPNEEDL